MSQQNHKIAYNGRGIRRLWRAGTCSWRGLTAAWQHEAAFRQEVVLVLVLTPLALWLGHDAVQRALLLGSLVPILVAELLNSALEAAIDRIGPERHPLAGRAKDMGSAAVLLALLQAAIIWGCILAGA